MMARMSCDMLPGRYATTLCALAMSLACASVPARAQEASAEEQDSGGTDILSAETLTAAADVRLVGVDGERSWVAGGFGKVRYGGYRPDVPSDFHIEPKFAEADLIWQPRFTWSLQGTVVALVQGGEDAQLGLSEAFLSWKPLSGGSIRFQARAGLMWPPVSLEHSGPEWKVTETITPSAINSWMGEEVKVIGAEFTATVRPGRHKFSLTGGLFDENDTAGALLAFRGWALHDRKATATGKQPLPPLNSFMTTRQPPYTSPVINMDGRFFGRPGYYVKLSWELPAPLMVDYLHYDNDGDPKAVNAELEWGWRTRFNTVGVVADLTPALQLRAQAMSGSTQMGYSMGGRIWVDTDFQSAYALFTRHFERGSVSARGEAFRTRNHGSAVTSKDDEDGWAATLAARREIDPRVSLLVEALHVSSDRRARHRANLAAQQSSNQLQISLRARW